MTLSNFLYLFFSAATELGTSIDYLGTPNNLHNKFKIMYTKIFVL